MDIKDSYLHGTIGVVKSINVNADELTYTLADKQGTQVKVTLPQATVTTNGVMSNSDKVKLDNLNIDYFSNIVNYKISLPDNSGRDAYILIAKLTNWVDGKSGDYGFIGRIVGYRGGNQLNTCCYNLVAMLSSYVSNDATIYTKQLYVDKHTGYREVLPCVVTYNGENYLALRKLGSGTAIYFEGSVKNVLPQSQWIVLNTPSGKSLPDNMTVLHSTNFTDAHSITTSKYFDGSSTKTLLHSGNHDGYTNKVKQNVTTNDSSYPLLLTPSKLTATTTTETYFDSGVALNPSTNTISANISGYAQQLKSGAKNSPKNAVSVGTGASWHTLPSSGGYAGDNTGFPAPHNSNGILWLGCHSNESDSTKFGSGGQLGFSGNGNIYYRRTAALGSFEDTINGGSWKQLAFTNSDITGNAATADKVNNNLLIKINTGSTEGTSLYTYNGSSDKTLDIKNGTGIGFTNTAGVLSIYNSGVRSISTGTANGTISVNTNGTSADVVVKGLGSAAYTNTSLYQKQNTIMNTGTDSVKYVKIVISGTAAEGYGIWVHSREQHYLIGSGLDRASTIKNKFWELGTALNSTDIGANRRIHIKMVATLSSNTVTLYAAIEGYNFMQVVTSGTVVVSDSTNTEYEGITSSTSGWVACTSAKWTDTTYNVVSNSANGLAPKVINTNTDTVGSAYYVLASTNGSTTPSWYKLPTNAFANDDTKVTQTNTTTSDSYRVLLSGNANDTTETTTARKSAKLTFNPSTGTLNTPISNITNQLVIANTGNAKHILFSRGKDTDYQYNYIAAPEGGYICILPNGVTNSSTSGMQFTDEGLRPATNAAYSLGSTSLKWNNVYANTFIGSLTGNVTGNATTATKLATKRKLWGLDFDGSADVSGSLSNVTTITSKNSESLMLVTPSGSNKFIYLRYNYDDNTSVCLTGTGFMPTKASNNKLTLGTSDNKWSTVYATTLIGNLNWSYITNVPSFAPANHQHNYITWVGDNRDTATEPSDYKSKFTLVGIKTPSAIGLTPAEAGTYVSLIGWKGYNDNSGPYSWELASGSAGSRLFVRNGKGIYNNEGNENWNNWNTIAYVSDLTWNNVANKPETFTPSAHEHPSSQITALTSYIKPTSASAIATTDSLNTALGKLEYKADWACDWITSVTADDIGTNINKWGEIVDFLDSVAEGTDITNEFVTIKTDQTITGLKSFAGKSTGVGDVGVSLELTNSGWFTNMQTAMDFYNGKDYKVPNARMSVLMNGNGNAGGTLIFSTQTKHASTNPNPNGLVERMRIDDNGLIKISGALTVTGNVTGTKFIGPLEGNADTASKLGTANKGSATKPIYLNAGTPTEGSTYAGGTAVTLNGVSKATTTASFYAPTDVGNSGQILVSQGSGRPVWKDMSLPYSSGNNSGANANSWYLLAELTRSANYHSLNITSDALFYLTDSYQRRNYGLLRVDVRIEANSGKITRIEPVWLVNKGFAADTVVVTYKYDNDTNTYIRLYVQSADHVLYGIRCIKISDGGFGSENGLWKLLSLRFTSIPSDETIYASTNAVLNNSLANSLAFTAGTFATKTYNGSAEVTVNVPTKTSHLTNDSGFLTQHQSLSNYVTLNTALTITGQKTFDDGITIKQKDFNKWSKIITYTSTSVENAETHIQGCNFTHKLKLWDKYAGGCNYAELSGGYINEALLKLTEFSENSTTATTKCYTKIGTRTSIFSGKVGIGKTPNQTLDVLGNIQISSANSNKAPKLVISEYYNGSNDWVSEIVSDYCGQNVCTESGFTHGLYIKLGRDLTFTNLNVLDANKAPIARISKVLGHWFDGTLSTTGNITLQTTSGDSPALVFQRGTLTDSSTDWRMYVIGGKLLIQNNISDKGWMSVFEFSDPETQTILKTSYNIVPSVNNTLTLGSSSLKWSNVYATTFTGDVTGSATYLPMTQINNESEISNKGIRGYLGSGADWTGMDTMGYGGILSVGNSTRGFNLWNSRGDDSCLWYRVGNKNGNAWEDKRTLLDSNNYTKYTTKSDSWECNTTVAKWSRLCSISGYCSVILTVCLNQNTQASTHTYLISTGYASARITQIGYNGYTSNAAASVRITKTTDTAYHVELLNNYGYNGATTVKFKCRSIVINPIMDNNGVTPIITYTLGSGTVMSELQSSYNKASNFNADLLDGKHASDFVDISSNLEVGGNKSFTKTVTTSKLNLANAGTYFLGGMTQAAIIYDSYTALNSGKYHPILGIKTSNNHVVNLGAYVDHVGFYGYKSNREDNGYDWSFIFNAETGALSHSGASITAIKFVKNGGTSSQFLKADGSVDSNSYVKTSDLPSLDQSGFNRILFERFNRGTITGSNPITEQDLVGKTLIDATLVDNFKSFNVGEEYLGRLTTYLYFSLATEFSTSAFSDDGSTLYLNDVVVVTLNSCVTTDITLNFVKGWNKIVWVFNENSGGDSAYFTPSIKTASNLLYMNAFPVATPEKVHQSYVSDVSRRLESTTVIASTSYTLSNEAWTDTTFNFTSLATGTYAIQVTSGTNLVASGIMSICTNLSAAGDEIPLHVYGTAGWRPYLRTYQNKLQISSNDNEAKSRTVTIKIAQIL